MKKLMTALTVLSFVALSAQTEKGNVFLEANTGTLATGNTSFSLSAADGNTSWSVGIDGGYFVMDDLALKVGLGYSDPGDIADGTFVYKLGAKYYIDGVFPLGVDFTGLSSDGFDASWLGLQGGYAIFLGDNVAIEPNLRYNVALDSDTTNSVFQALVGFVIFL